MSVPTFCPLMLVEALPALFSETGMPTGVVPTKNCTVPVGTHEGAEVLHDEGVKVVVTVKGTENCGLPVAGEVKTVADVVALRCTPTPLSTIDGVNGRAGVMLASVKLALKFPSATGLNCAARKHVAPGVRFSPPEQPREPWGTTENNAVSPEPVKIG